VSWSFLIYCLDSVSVSVSLSLPFSSVVVLGFELRASYLQASALLLKPHTHPFLLYLFFQIGSFAFTWCQPQTMIFLPLPPI
jgi:hypothetical protein